MSRNRLESLGHKFTALLLTVAVTTGVMSAQFAPDGNHPPLQQQELAQLRARIDEQRRVNMARLRDRARDLEGATVINDVALPQQTLAGLVLVRDVYIQQLRTFIAQANKWKALSTAQKKAAVRALDQYNGNYIMTGNVAVWPKEGINRCDALDMMNLRLASEFQPILAVSPPGVFSSTFSDLLTKAPGSPDFDDLTKQFDQYLDYGIQGARDEIWRVQPINTVEGITEFLGPQYANTWQAAANLYGRYTWDLMSTLPEFASTYQQVRRGQAEQRRYKLAAAVGVICIVAVVAAPAAYLVAGEGLVATGQAVGSALNLGATLVQLGYDGNEFIGVYGELSNAQRGGAALGPNSASTLRGQVYTAGAGLVLDGTFVGVSAAEFKTAIQGLNKPAANAVENAARDAAGGAATSRGSVATNAVGTGTEIIRPPSQVAEGSVERGIEKARSLGISTEEINRNATVAMTPQDAIGSLGYRGLINQIQGLFEGIDELGALEAQARAAGVAEDTIRAAFTRARQATTNQLQAFGRNLPAELQVLTARAKGLTLVVNPESMEAFVDMVGAAASQGVVNADTGMLNTIATKLNILGSGRAVQWTEEEVRLLAAARSFSNRANLYAYSAGEGQLYRVFTDHELTIADSFFNNSNRYAIARGEMALPPAPRIVGGLPMLPPTALANPATGEWLTAQEIRALSASQIARIEPEIVQSLGDGPVRTALTERMVSEASRITVPPAACPPPQITPVQMMWAVRTLSVLGGATPTFDVPKRQLAQEKDFDPNGSFGDSRRPGIGDTTGTSLVAQGPADPPVGSGLGGGGGQQSETGTTGQGERERKDKTTGTDDQDSHQTSGNASGGNQGGNEGASSRGIGPTQPLGGASDLGTGGHQSHQAIQQNVPHVDDHALASTLCERARWLRQEAGRQRNFANQAADSKSKAYFEGEAKMLDSMAREREEAAHRLDPNACPDIPQPAAANDSSTPDNKTPPAEKPANDNSGNTPPSHVPEDGGSPANDIDKKDKAALLAPAGASTVPAASTWHTHLTARNSCSTRQTFTVETEGFSNTFLQTSGPITIEPGTTDNFTLTLNTHGMPPGVHSGRFIITCTSCGSNCTEVRRVLPYQFFIPEDAAAGDVAGPNERRVISDGVVAGYISANPDPIDKAEHPYIFRRWLPADLQFAFMQPTSVDVRPDGTVVERGKEGKTLGTVQR